MTGFNKVMRFCNTLQDYESAKNQGTITDDLFVVILQDKLAKFKGQTFDWSENADLTALATKGELEDLAEEIASNERVWAEALNDLNERINEIGTGGGGGTSDIIVDAALSTTSTNAIQNKAVANALNEKADASALASKQDTLVSGTNIKTVQGQSILGSGNISISVPTVDAALSSTSTNAVQNKVVKAAIDELQQEDVQIETKLAELSEVVGNITIEFPKQAYAETQLPAILEEGRTIIAINGADSIILKPANGGSNFFVNAGDLPYVLTKAVTSFYATTANAGNFVVSGELESKLSKFVVKEEGKGLSSNDFTTSDKDKLDSLQNYNDEELRDAITKKANVGGIYTTSEVDSKIAELSSLNDATKTEVDSLKESSRQVDSKIASLSSQSSILQTQIENATSEIQGLNDDIDTFKQAITEQVANYKPVEITGNVTNAADEEDITAENNLLKLKNRSAVDGMGYVILRKNKSFAEQVTNANTIYEIRYNFDLNAANVSLPSNVILYFVGGKISNGSLVGNESLLDAPQVHIFSGVTLKGTWNVSRIFSKWWENKDNVLAYSISAMCSNKGSYYVEFEQGSIYQYEYFGNKAAGGYTDPIIQFKDCEYVDVNLNGSTHIILPNDSQRYNVIDLCNCEMAYVHDGILVGDRKEHDYTTADATHEHGHGLLISGKRFKIERLDIYDMVGDAIFAGDLYNWSTSEYVSRIHGGEINDCKLHNCRRQGISFGDTLTESIIEVRRCHIYDIGSSDNISGTAPQSGIDIEPGNFSKQNGMYKISDTIIERCTESSLICSNPESLTQRISVTNCILRGACNLSSASSVLTSDSHFVVDEINKNVLPFLGKAQIDNTQFDFTQSGMFVYFVDCKLNNCVVNGASDRKVNFGNYQKCSEWHNCVINNIGGQSSSSYPGVDFPIGGLASIQDTTTEPHTFVNCILNRCSAMYGSSNKGTSYKGCTMNDCSFLGLNKCKVEDCTINNAIRIGSIYHDPIGGTFVNCIINEDFATTYARENSLIMGGYQEPIKAIRSSISMTDAGSVATKDHLKFKAFLSYIELNIDALLSMANMEAYNSVIKGSRESYDGKGENNHYEHFVQGA